MTNYKFECFYDNDGSNDRIKKIQDVLYSMSVLSTRVVFGWVVTRTSKDAFEVGTIGKDENVWRLC